jgi:hypothetical protein
MALATALKNAADAAIKKIGSDVTIEFVTLGSYNTVTGEAFESSTSVTVKGVLDNVKKSEINDLAYGANKVGLLQISKRLTVSALSLTNEPMPDDRVILSSKTYQIVTVETVMQENVAVVYDIYLKA